MARDLEQAGGWVPALPDRVPSKVWDKDAPAKAWGKDVVPAGEVVPVQAGGRVKAAGNKYGHKFDDRHGQRQGRNR